jgi:hypothetical protein
MDPTLYVAGSSYHSTQILTSTTFTGTSALVSSYQSMIYGIQQNLWNGTQIQLGLSSILNYNQNATTAIFNPYDSGTLGLTITQPLLNGFGLALNQRSYRKAKNNLKANDLQFKPVLGLGDVRRRAENQAADPRSGHQAVRGQQAPRGTGRHRPD